jgi:hypothetical protein
VILGEVCVSAVLCRFFCLKKSRVPTAKQVDRPSLEQGWAGQGEIKKMEAAGIAILVHWKILEHR